LETIIKNAPPGGIFNNAAQAWNHTFVWHSKKPHGASAPSGALSAAIDKKWGFFDESKKAFQASAVCNFGSGWTWLVKTVIGSVDIANTRGVGTPIAGADKPLLAIDVCEHAYYIDFRNRRPKFVEAFLAPGFMPESEKN